MYISYNRPTSHQCRDQCNNRLFNIKLKSINIYVYRPTNKIKYLSNYTEEATTRALNKYGAFFAFSDKQFEEAKDPNIDAKDYVNMSMGLIAPRKNASELAKAIENAISDGIYQDIKENGINNIVIRELYNHEALYTCDIESTKEALKNYPNITEELILSIFNFERKNRQTS